MGIIYEVEDYKPIELPLDKSGGLVTCDFCYETVISPVLVDYSKRLLQMFQEPDGNVICEKCKDEEPICDHPALTGTDDPNVDKCDGCGVMIRDVPDPNGDCTAMDFKTKKITRFRQEVVGEVTR